MSKLRKKRREKEYSECTIVYISTNRGVEEALMRGKL